MKRNLIYVAVLLALAFVYAYFFTDWFKPKHIEIFHTSRSIPNSRIGARVQAGSAETRLILFGLDGPYKLTEIKVVPLDQWKTNPAVLPLWHLISDSNSVPVREFPYGRLIRGMKPSVGKEWPQPLETNVTYRIFVAAGSIKGQHDFTALPKPGGK